MIKHDIRHIIEHKEREHMEQLECIIDELIEELKDYDKHEYEHIAYKIHKIAYDGHLGKELAEKWCMNMQNKDGSHGGHWTWEQTEEVRKQYAQKQESSDFYAVMNMMFSDYYNPRFDVQTYVQLAIDWLDDKDVDGCKTLKYYMKIVK